MLVLVAASEVLVLVLVAAAELAIGDNEGFGTHGFAAKASV